MRIHSIQIDKVIMHAKIKQFLAKMSAWASTQADIQAVALVGSYARNTATETSDVDLVIITTNPQHYLHNFDWIQQFGTVEKHHVEPYGLLTSLRVWYSDGREIEYGITDERWVAMPLDEGSRRVITDGIQILFERNHILSCHTLHLPTS